MKTKNEKRKNGNQDTSNPPNNMTIPNPVLDAKQAADKVIAIEKVINAEYKRNKRLTNAMALETAMVQFRHLFEKVMQLYPEWSHLIPNVSKPIHKRISVN